MPLLRVVKLAALPKNEVKLLTIYNTSVYNRVQQLAIIVKFTCNSEHIFYDLYSKKLTHKYLENIF